MSFQSWLKSVKIQNFNNIWSKCYSFFFKKEVKGESLFGKLSWLSFHSISTSTNYGSPMDPYIEIQSGIWVARSRTQKSSALNHFTFYAKHENN